MVPQGQRVIRVVAEGEPSVLSPLSAQQVFLSMVAGLAINVFIMFPPYKIKLLKKLIS